MTCKGFLYEEGKEYKEDKAVACLRGFHACEYPLDVFAYYDPAKSVFREVEQSGELSRNSDDSKVSSTKIKIGASINITGLVKAAIEYTTKRVKKENDSDEDYGASSATGDYGASSATGYCGASSATGYCGASSVHLGTFLREQSISHPVLRSINTVHRGLAEYHQSPVQKEHSSATGSRDVIICTGTLRSNQSTGYCGASFSHRDLRYASSATGVQGSIISHSGHREHHSATGYCGASSATGTTEHHHATGYMRSITLSPGTTEHQSPLVQGSIISHRGLRSIISHRVLRSIICHRVQGSICCRK